MPALVIRHASAGNRSKWSGDDRLRPLDPRGREQALALPALLAGAAVTRILSSPFLRCVQTVEPLAAERGLGVELEELLAEEQPRAQQLALVRAAALADEALCVHGDLLDELLPADRRRAKGSVWVVEARDGELQPLRYLPPPA
jgi:phosphohistidine phosphatase SixA